MDIEDRVDAQFSTDLIFQEINNGGLCVFCGAGASFYSDVPLANSLVLAVLKASGMIEKDQQNFLEARLPFESTMEVLLDNTDPGALFNVFRGTGPNRNHLLFARLALCGLLKIVVTTNYDTFFEEALARQGIPFNLYYRDDALKRIKWNSVELPIVKLHGTLDDPKSLAITIRGVANQSLVSSRRTAIKELFAQKQISTVLVFGYSCSDRFDIGPAIEAIDKSLQRVIYVEHSPLSWDEASLEDIGHCAQNPFARLEGKILRCNADDLIKTLWIKYIDSTFPPAPPPIGSWEPLLQLWFQDAVARFGPTFKDYLAGQLLKRAGLYRRSTDLLKNVLTEECPGDLKMSACQSIGDNYRDLGEYRDALHWLRTALALSSERNLLARQARALASIGVVFEDMKDHVRAISCYKRSMRLSRRGRDRELEGKCNGNVGIVYKQFGDPISLVKSIRYHENALRIAQQVGDKGSEGRTLGNLGITHSDSGNKQRAIEYYREALTIAKDLGDVRHVGIWAINAGMDLIDSDPTQAKVFLEQAKDIFTKLSVNHLVEECETSLRKLIRSENRS